MAIDTLVVKMFLVRHMILQDHKTKKLCDFLGGSPTAKFANH